MHRRERDAKRDTKRDKKGAARFEGSGDVTERKCMFGSAQAGYHDGTESVSSPSPSPFQISKEIIMFAKLFASATVAHAHCDLYCAVYDPAQAKIEALSVVKIANKYHESDDDVFRTRCIILKEQRAEETKHHLMVLWADFFTPAHYEEFPQLQNLFWKATNQAGVAKKSMDPADGEQLVVYIDEIADIFWQTDKGKQMGVYPPS
jgi:nickel superoxide dismutase